MKQASGSLTALVPRRRACWPADPSRPGRSALHGLSQYGMLIKMRHLRLLR